MNRNAKVWFGLLGLWLALFCSAHNLSAQQTPEIVKIRGANSVASLVNAWATAFQESNPASRVIVSGGGAAAAFEGLFEKTCQLVMATREINEKEIQAAALSGAKPVKSEICRECLAIITHPGNPVTDVTLEQLGKILTGNYNSWNQVGGSDNPILVISSDQTAGTAQFLRAKVMDNGYFSGDARIRDFYTDIIKDVARPKPVAISYAGLTDALRGERAKSVKILGIRKGPGSSPVLPSVDALKSGSYPLVVPLYFYWDDASVSTSARQFVDFCKRRCEAGP